MKSIHELKKKVAMCQAISTVQQLIFVEKELRIISRLNGYSVDYGKCKNDDKCTIVPFGKLLCLDEFAITFYVEESCESTIKQMFEGFGVCTDIEFIGGHLYEIEPVFKYYSDNRREPSLHFNILNKYNIESTISDLPDKYRKRSFSLHVNEELMFHDIMELSGMNVCEMIENRRIIIEGVINYCSVILCNAIRLYSDKRDALGSAVASGVVIDRISVSLSSLFPIGAVYNSSNKVLKVHCSIPVLSETKKITGITPSSERGHRDTFYKLKWLTGPPDIAKGDYLK